MKKVLFASVVAMIWAFPAPAADDTFNNLAEQTIKTIDEFTAILAKVTDKKSADESKSKFEETAKTMADLVKRSQKLGEPSAEQKAELDKKYKAKIDAAAKHLQAELNRIAMKVDGGQEIVQDFGKLLKPFKKKEK